MPEGDTLHRTAAVLAQALVGQTLVAVSGRLPALDRARLVGQKVTAVDAHGKNLVIAFADGRALHTHLQMHGSWHLYRPGERWRRPAHAMRVVLDVGDIAAVCFDAPTLRLLASQQIAHDPRLAQLGPDLLADDFDLRVAIAGLRRGADLALGEAVMDQTLIAGIGNIYKSETLFLVRKSPFAKVGSLSDAELGALVERARLLMSANTRGSSRMRATRLLPGQYWVYRRAGLPCLACGQAVQMQRQGQLQRSTYFCAHCQHVAPTPAQ
jgi:endonuclease-8